MPTLTLWDLIQSSPKAQRVLPLLMIFICPTASPPLPHIIVNGALARCCLYLGSVLRFKSATPNCMPNLCPQLNDEFFEHHDSCGCTVAPLPLHGRPVQCRPWLKANGRARESDLSCIPCVHQIPHGFRMSPLDHHKKRFQL